MGVVELQLNKAGSCSRRALFAWRVFDVCMFPSSDVGPRELLQIGL